MWCHFGSSVALSSTFLFSPTLPSLGKCPGRHFWDSRVDEGEFCIPLSITLNGQRRHTQNVTKRGQQLDPMEKSGAEAAALQLFQLGTRVVKNILLTLGLPSRYYCRYYCRYCYHESIFGFLKAFAVAG